MAAHAVWPSIYINIYITVMLCLVIYAMYHASSSPRSTHVRHCPSLVRLCGTPHL